VSIALAPGFSITGSGGDAQGDSVSGTIENLIGSAFNDTLIGDAVAGSVTDNRLDGGAGNDTLQGGAGNDTLIGGAGNDVLNGGTGIDTADYSGSSAGVTVAVAQSFSITGSGGDAQGDSVSGTIENLIGSAFNDTLIGDFTGRV
jgi:Ca2+-binding RTX toxin-like protein